MLSCCIVKLRILWSHRTYSHHVKPDGAALKDDITQTTLSVEYLGLHACIDAIATLPIQLSYLVDQGCTPRLRCVVLRL